MMTTRILLAVLASSLVVGADEKKPAEKAARPARVEAKAEGIPPDAKEIEPGVYRWKDREGKSWILRNSPFGVLKGEEKTEPAVAEQDLPQGLKVIEEGDELRFERATPFGITRWRKKKTDLDEMEQRAWEREQKKKSEKKAKE